MADGLIPKTCEECINSNYKLEKPDCAYEQGLEHKRTYTYFKKTYNATLQQHLDAMFVLKQQKEECLERIRAQAIKIQSLRKALDVDSILNKITYLNERIDSIENGEPVAKEIEDKDRILAPPKDVPEEYERKFIKPRSHLEKSEEHVEIKPAKKASQKTIPLKDRGWLMYVRNTKKENVEQYVNQLRVEKPELTDDQIKISVNAAGNYMIRYTLNPDIA